MLRALSPKTLGWEPYIHLVWLVFLVFPLLTYLESTWRDWLILALMLTLFFPLYVSSFRPGRRGRLLSILGLTLLGLVFVPLNYGAATFFIYAGSAAAYALRPKRAALVLVGIAGVAVVGALISGLAFPDSLYAFLPPILLILVIGGFNIFEAERSRSNKRLQLAQDELEHLATIAERERIARDLHDLLGHTLSVITLKSELAGKLIDKDNAKAKEEIGDVERISRETLHEVRAAVTGYRSRGFMAEVASAKLACEAAGVSFTFRGDASVLTPLQESTLSLVLREAVTNVIRHAGATRCYAELTRLGEVDKVNRGLLFEIVDNGGGTSKVEEGNGLSSIRERAQLLGGKLTLTSLRGTRLSIHLPLEVPLPAEHATLTLQS